MNLLILYGFNWVRMDGGDMDNYGFNNYVYRFYLFLRGNKKENWYWFI